MANMACNALPETVVIRRAHDGDRLRVVAQQIDSQNEEATFHESRVSGEAIAGIAWEMIHQRGGCMLIAEESGELIGHVGGALTRDVSPFFKNNWQEYAMIFDLYVAPNHRRRGIGKAMVQQMMALLKEAGATRFRIVGLAANPAALSLYRACGFFDYEITLEHNIS
jgi:ribosomal protein S18 acetylase RimI-like enzyme